jgi:hypothetical protein
MRRSVAFVLMCCAALASGARAQTQPGATPRSFFEPEPTTDEQINDGHLHFTLLRRGGHNVLYAWAGIEEGDYDRFKEALERGQPVSEIIFFSPGGALEEALRIGRLIRSYRLTTHIRNGHECISACNFMFMGGTVREMDSQGVFRVHMFANDNLADTVLSRIDRAGTLAQTYNQKHPTDKVDPEKVVKETLAKEMLQIQQNSAQVAAEIARYLSEMSISLRFLTEFADIPNETPLALSRDQLRDFNIVNVD